MRAVKVAVFVMGGLIVLGFVVIVAELLRRGLTGPDDGPAALVDLAPDQLGLEERERIAGMAAVGDMVVLLVEAPGPDADQRLLLVDPARLIAERSILDE